MVEHPFATFSSTHCYKWPTSSCSLWLECGVTDSRVIPRSLHKVTASYLMWGKWLSSLRRTDSSWVDCTQLFKCLRQLMNSSIFINPLFDIIGIVSSWTSLNISSFIVFLGKIMAGGKKKNKALAANDLDNLASFHWNHFENYTYSFWRNQFEDFLGA